MVRQPTLAQKRAQGIAVFYGQTRALSLMRKGRVSGVAEKYHPTATPSGQARQVDQSPEAHIPLDVAHQIENATIPAILLEDAECLLRRGRRAIRRLGPCREAMRLVYGQQVYQLAPVEPVVDNMRTGSAPQME